MPITLIDRAAAWREHLDACRAKGLQVGLVPTMGALHAGHMSLIRRAAGECDVVAVTDYVNPLQFGPAEDLTAYPRDLDGDCRLAEEAGASVLFAPSPEEMWPVAPTTTVRVEGLTERMEGASRPGHFEGVATIVAKLFSLSGPCWAYFGEKDFQQLAVVRRMVTDLSLPVEVVGCPTVRDADGLALSSRNAYLSAAERAVAPRLFWALLAGKRAVEDDRVVDPARVEAVMAASVAEHPALELDYAEVADPETLERPARIEGPVRLLIAARLGAARLIDNVEANPPTRAD
ncbi:MAG TPA: pantoate--beta-alanine ligase [Acidimicrobiales bacterium]|nr:pantoate--beta-alanine ligase [Acidimicrobiales bacterium]